MKEITQSEGQQALLFVSLAVDESKKRRNKTNKKQTKWI